MKMRGWTLTALLVSAVLSSCKKEPAKPASPPKASLPAATSEEVPKGFDKWKPEVQAYWLNMSSESRAHWLAGERCRSFEDEKRGQDRLELVSPPPKGFKPENVKRKLKLTLIPKSTTIKAGEQFWFALEIQNVGREPVYFHEPDSYLKLGDFFGIRWDFYLTQPDGKTIKLHPAYDGPGMDLPDLRRWKNGGTRITEEQAKELLASSSRCSWDSSSMEVTLQPGETLRSRAWHDIPIMEAYAMRDRGEDPGANYATGRWRELFVGYQFKKPGKYKLKVVYDDPLPRKPTEAGIQREIERGYSRESTMRMYRTDVPTHVGRIVSKPISFEVVP
jgi:hypothetical protein